MCARQNSAETMISLYLSDPAFKLSMCPILGPGRHTQPPCHSPALAVFGSHQSGEAGSEEMVPPLLEGGGFAPGLGMWPSEVVRPKAPTQRPPQSESHPHSTRW